MKKIAALVYCFFLLHITFLNAQAPYIEWQRCLGGNNGDYAFSVEPTTDGGYISAGYTEGTDNGDIVGYHGNPFIQDIWVVKQDKDGKIQWQKCLGGSYEELGAYIHQTPDGGYIVAGSTTSVDCNVTGNHGGMDFWVVKLAADGNVVWQKCYGGSQHEYAYSIAPSNDGGYFVAGFSASADGDVTVNHGNRDYWVIKIDGTGNLVWQKSYGGSGDDEAMSVQATSDGGCVVAGYSSSTDGDVTGNHGQYDYWVIKLGSGGNLQWQKSLGGSNIDYGAAVRVTADGGYIVAGTSGSNNGNVSGNHQSLGAYTDFWVVKLDNAGNIQWQKCYGGNRNETAFDIRQAPDGGYVVAGEAESINGGATCNAGLTDMWVIKITSAGVLQWQQSYGGAYNDVATCIQALPDGSFIACGETCSSDVSGYHPHNTSNGTCGDFWVVKLTGPASGQPPLVITITPQPYTVCAGATGTFTATTKYAGIICGYQWIRNGYRVGTGPTYSASDFVAGDWLQCQVISGGGCDLFLNNAPSGTVKIVIDNTTIQPQIKITADTTNLNVCSCSRVTFTAAVSNGGTSPVYQWNVNGVNTGCVSNVFVSSTLNTGDVVTCVYSDKASCVAKGSVTSNAIKMTTGFTKPRVNIAASAIPVCTGSPITFTASLVYATTTTGYQWKVNGVSAGANSSTFTSSSLQNGDMVNCTIPPDPRYVCVVPDSIISNTIVITTNNALLPAVSITTPSAIICTGAAAGFTATAVNAGQNPSYQWAVNGVSAGTNSSSFTAPPLSNGDEVSCVLTPGGNTCSAAPVSSNIITMTINALPVVAIDPADTIVAPGSRIQLNATASVSLASYNWSPGNELQPPLSLSPVTVPLYADTSFILTVMSTGGCPATATAIIKIGLPGQPVHMPNAFTPNDDGHNDVFRIPPGVSLLLSDFSVYDRWGNKIFTTRDIGQGWDGRINGLKADAGVYVYTIKGKDDKGSVSIRGTVVLIR